MRPPQVDDDVCTFFSGAGAGTAALSRLQLGDATTTVLTTQDDENNDDNNEVEVDSPRKEHVPFAFSAQIRG